MTYTLIFKDDKPYLREMPTMEKPEFKDGYDAFDRALNFKLAQQVYDSHLASLPCYPLLNMPESWKGLKEIKGEWVRLQWQTLESVNDCPAHWVDCTENFYHSEPPEYRRIVFTPAEQVGGGWEGKEWPVVAKVLRKKNGDGFATYVNRFLFYGELPQLFMPTATMELLIGQTDKEDKEKLSGYEFVDVLIVPATPAEQPGSRGDGDIELISKSQLSGMRKDMDMALEREKMYDKALRNLCNLKKWKDEHGKDHHYEQFQPEAWAYAFSVIEMFDPYPERPTTTPAPSSPGVLELAKDVESIRRNAEKINEHTWATYKEQVLMHVSDIEKALAGYASSGQSVEKK